MRGGESFLLSQHFLFVRVPRPFPRSIWGDRKLVGQLQLFSRLPTFYYQQNPTNSFRIGKNSRAETGKGNAVDFSPVLLFPLLRHHFPLFRFPFPVSDRGKKCGNWDFDRFYEKKVLQPLYEKRAQA